MKNIQRLFNDNWAIRRSDLVNTMTLILPSIIKGDMKSASDLLAGRPLEVKAVALPDIATEYDIDDATLPDGTVAVIRLKGTLYAWETEWLIRVLARIGANPRICGTLLVIDGPGGMVSHVDQAAAAIRKSAKPIAAICTGIMASAHFWIGSAADRTFIASPLCEVGSVGVVVTHLSFKEYFKMAGIDYREIYPDTADLKNKATRELEETGSEELIKKHARTIHEAFCNDVAGSLGIAYDPELPLFRGEMFFGDQAVGAGYIDQMGTVEDAIIWVYATATSRKANSINN